MLRLKLACLALIAAAALIGAPHRAGGRTGHGRAVARGIAPGAASCQTRRVFAVVVTGPPGAGKTVTLTALSDALVRDGHEVLVEHQAGVGSGYEDSEYALVGARLVDADEAWGAAQAPVTSRAAITGLRRGANVRVHQSGRC